MAIGEPVSALSVGARMSALPMTRTHRRVVFAVSIGLFFDVYEIFLASAMGTVLIRQFDMGPAALPLVLSSTFLGMFAGGLVLGRLADSVGRRGAFLFNLVLYSAFTLLGAFSPNATFLVVTRFFAGVGVGAEHPLADVYLGDVLPARQRGRYSAWAYTFSYVAVPLVGFASLLLVPSAPLGIAGWRWLLVLGSVGAMAILVMRRTLPESPRWLAATGRRQEAEAVLVQFGGKTMDNVSQRPSIVRPARPAALPLRTLIVPPYGRRTGMLVVFHLLQTVGYYGFGTLAPLVLVARGYTITQSLLFSALTFLGYPLGSLLSITVVERFQRKDVLIGSCLGMAVAGLAFGVVAATPVIVFAGSCFTVLSNVFSNAYHIYQAEIFPTSLRATATSWTYSLSRLSSAVMPFLLVPLLHSRCPGALFTTVAAVLVVVAMDVAVLGPRTNGRPLEEVNPTPTGIRSPRHRRPSRSGIRVVRSRIVR